MDASAVGSIGGWQLAVPLILLVIMVSMGMELAPADFRRVVELPRAALVGLAGQMLLLPAVGVAFAHWPGFAPEIAIGVVIIAACPGGATSNVFSYLARANVALSLTLTSLSSVLCFATIPFWINLGLALFGGGPDGAGAPLRLPVGRTAAQLLVVTLLPVGVGMLIRARWPEQSARVRAPLRRFMAVLMAVALVTILAGEWVTVTAHLESAAGAALLLVSAMLAAAWGLARASRLDERDAFTISIEVGLQNGALATTIAVSLLERPELIVFPGSYAVLSFLPVSAWTLAMRRRFGHSDSGTTTP
ncbi:MAG TPA: bile acid:sodium symporter family protein [Alphaproteobacteria bacterium]|nr:bile acid:sodium symporter family protein [Alphaproteobacteria bacterium]